MGYASTVPFSLMKSAVGTTFSTIITYTTGDNTYTVCTVETPDFHEGLTYAYAELFIGSRRDTSGALNYHNSANFGQLILDNGTSTISCGLIPNYAFMVPASSYECSVYRLPFPENVATFLEPNKTYTAKILHGTAVGNNLELFDCWVELTLIFTP